MDGLGNPLHRIIPSPLFVLDNVLFLGYNVVRRSHSRASSSPVDREARKEAREHAYDRSAPIPPPQTRQRTLTLPLPTDTSLRLQKTHEQSQPDLLAKSALEIRTSICLQALRGKQELVHIVRKTNKIMGHSRCKGRCHAPKDCCSGYMDDDGDGLTMDAQDKTDRDLLPLLIT